MTAILGISAFYHDAAAALVLDGRVVAAAQEERFSRIKHDAAFPARAIQACLDAAQLTPGKLDFVGFYEKPLRKFDRLLEGFLGVAPRGLGQFTRAMPLWLRHRLHLGRELDRGLAGAFRKRTLFCEHHQSHAAAAFFPSPFQRAAILTVDGVGEWTTASWGSGQGNRIQLHREQRYPHSLGMLYSAFTHHCGFRVNSGEYKLMGLAPFGQPVFAHTIRDELLDLKPDGSFRLNLDCFAFHHGRRMTSARFERLFGGPARSPGQPLTRREMDLAASIQAVTEEILLAMAAHIHARTGLSALCMAGGVALNAAANGRLLRQGPFERIWVQPAAGDAGGALGVALWIWHQLLGEPRPGADTDRQLGSLLGPAFSSDQAARRLQLLGAVFETIGEEGPLLERVARLLDEGRVVGWFQGRMEFGPRALGARSILADARDPHMRSRLNRAIKFREGFRPFAPAVLAHRARDYFDLPGGDDSPFMLFIAPVARSRLRSLSAAEQALQGLDRLGPARSDIPAVTHVDDTARLQTVDAQRHGRFHRLLEAFERRTACPVLVNTSFNVRGEPIVHSPEEAWRCFMATGMDALVVEDHLLLKDEQSAHLHLQPAAHLAGFAPD